jgi:hypothetical protein
MGRTSGITGVFAIVLLYAGADVPRAQVRQGVVPLVPATTEIGGDSSQFVQGDTIEIVARRELLPRERSDLSRYRFLAHPDFRARHPVPVSLLLRPRTIELSRFSCAMHGADLGAGTASALGGLGLVSGVWGEKTTGYLMGAGAILGAIWGGTAGADNSGFRMRVGVDASDPAASRHRSLPNDRRP